MGRSKEFRNDGLELVVNHKEQIVYIIQKIEAPRSI